MVHWAVAYLAIGFFVSIAVEAHIRHKHGQQLPKYGSSDWGDTCFFAALVTFLWPLAIVTLFLHAVCGKLVPLLKYRNWAHPSWYLVHLPYRLVEKAMHIGKRGNGN